MGPFWGTFEDQGHCFATVMVGSGAKVTFGHILSQSGFPWGGETRRSIPRYIRHFHAKSGECIEEWKDPFAKVKDVSRNGAPRPLWPAIIQD